MPNHSSIKTAMDVLIKAQQVPANERFENMVRRGLINRNGEPTRLIGGDAAPEADSIRPNVYTIEVDENIITTVRVGVSRGKAYAAVYGRASRALNEIGTSVEQLLTEQVPDQAQRIEVRASHQGGQLVAEVVQVPSAREARWQWRLLDRREAPAHRVTLRDAVQDVFTALLMIEDTLSAALNLQSLIGRLDAMGFTQKNESPGFRDDLSFRHWNTPDSKTYGSVWVGDGIIRATGKHENGYETCLKKLVAPTGTDRSLDNPYSFWTGQDLLRLLAEMEAMFQAQENSAAG